MLNHIGISANNIKEIEDFYMYILGFEEQYNFKIDANTVSQIFKIEEEIEVHNLVKEDIVLEIFLYPSLNKEKHFNHLCINTKDISALIEKLKEKGYIYTLIERPNKTLLFAYDKSGNIFEIKEDKG